MLHFQQQPDSHNCVTACIAMIVDRSVDELIEELDTLKSSIPEGQVNNWDVEDRFAHAQFYSKFAAENIVYFGHRPREIKQGHVYMLTVPGINIPGNFHSVVLDWTDEHPVILDPSKGRRNGQAYYYVWGMPSDKIQIMLETWLVRFQIKPTRIVLN